MREYARISPKFWIGATGKQIRQLGPECQVVALYLLTSPHANMIGLYYLPIAYISHDTGLSPAKAEVALAKLIAAGFCDYDEAVEVVWVYEMCRYQIGSATKLGDKQLVGAAHLYEDAPDCRHLAAFFVRYQQALPLEKQRGIEPKKPLSSPSEALAKPFDGPSRQSDEQGDGDSDERRARATSDEQGDGEKQKALSSKLDESTPAETEVGATDVLAVFNHYRTHHERAHPKPSSKSKEWRAIRARLDEGYTVDDLKLAIDGCHKTPWNCGENPSGVLYQKLELIVRDGSQVNRFAETAKQYANGPPQVLSEQTRRNLRAAEVWVAKSREELKNAGT